VRDWWFWTSVTRQRRFQNWKPVCRRRVVGHMLILYYIHIYMYVCGGFSYSYAYNSSGMSICACKKNICVFLHVFLCECTYVTMYGFLSIAALVVDSRLKFSKCSWCVAVGRTMKFSECR
jgi:hypothetical protein